MWTIVGETKRRRRGRFSCYSHEKKSQSVLCRGAHFLVLGSEYQGAEAQFSIREPTPFAIARSPLLATGVLNSRLCLLNGLLDQLQRPEPVATFVC